MEASVNMPLEQGVRTIDHPAGVAAVSRRAAIRAALGAWLGAQFGVRGREARAQTPVATPTTGLADETQPGIGLPDGITQASDAPSAAATPARGGALRLVRPGKSLGNFNPSAFQQDQQIPVSY